MSPLKLGRLPDRETVKIAFAASTELNRLLEVFIKVDRGFRRKQISALAETDQVHKIA